jgi:nucleotide-binding universal stress UspA family protein
MNAFSPRKILVPFDFTELSRAALANALQLAEKSGGEVELLYAAPEPAGEAVLAKLQRVGGPGTTARVVAADPVAAVAARAAELPADLVVMGTEGRFGLRRFARPSVAERVVRVSPAPVLVVRGFIRSPRSVLAPVSLEPYSRAGLLEAAEIAAQLEALLTVLCVVGSQELVPEARRGLAAMLAGLPPALARSVRPWLRVDVGSPLPRILEQAPAFDLVVLVSHRRGPLGDAVAGTTAERLIRRCPSAVLAVPFAVGARAGAPAG